VTPDHITRYHRSYGHWNLGPGLSTLQCALCTAHPTSRFEPSVYGRFASDFAGQIFMKKCTGRRQLANVRRVLFRIPSTPSTYRTVRYRARGRGSPAGLVSGPSDRCRTSECTLAQCARAEKAADHTRALRPRRRQTTARQPAHRPYNVELMRQSQTSLAQAVPMMGTVCRIRVTGMYLLRTYRW
jgi:hypothetical protein